MDGAFGLKPGVLQGEILLNLDSETEGELYVGCAGGLDANTTFRYEAVPTPAEGYAAAKLVVKGLKGGHSGIQIVCQRANANKLLFRFLNAAPCEVLLASVDGGGLRNAIPREAEAVVLVPEAQYDAFAEAVAAYEKTVCPTCGSCAGMFTANSMNCLTEAIGLALPGNGTILASHSYRKDLFKRAAQQVVKIAHQYYDDSDDSVLPRSIATKEAFENAMTMDVAMGGSTNTVLHILAMAQSADVDFTLDDIERISHTVPCICKASPSGKWEISDVHRAGGITGILGELERAGKLHTNVHSIDYPTLEAKLADWDIMRPTCTEEAQQMYKAAPGHIISPEPWTHTTLFDSLDRDRANGAIHDINHPEIHEGGLAVLRGNLAPDGCVVKTAGVPPEIWKFRGPALVVDSQEQAIEVILNDTLKPGMALVIRYEGPKGGPGMQEMLYPTSFVKGKGIGKQVAMLTDGRYSGGSSGLAIGHMAPEAANKGPVALIKNGDIIDIDIEARSVNVELTDEQLDERRRELEAGDGYVAHRNRHVSQALKAYAAFARSADKGATRDPELINKLSGLN